MDINQELKSISDSVSKLKTQVDGIVEELDNRQTIYTNSTIGELLNISPKLVRKYRDTGLLPFHRVDDKFWYTSEDVAAFLRSTETGGYRCNNL